MGGGNGQGLEKAEGVKRPVGDEFGSPRKSGDVQRNAVRYFILEPRYSPHNPYWEKKQAERLLPQQNDQGFDQQVGFDESSVEIDYQRRRGSGANKAHKAATATGTGQAAAKTRRGANTAGKIFRWEKSG